MKPLRIAALALLIAVIGFSGGAMDARNQLTQWLDRSFVAQAQPPKGASETPTIVRLPAAHHPLPPSKLVPVKWHRLSHFQRKHATELVKLARARHMKTSEIRAMLWIAWHESGFSPKARSGSCKGVFELKTHSKRWRSMSWNFRHACKYVHHRYGSWTLAWAFHKRHGWY